MKELHNKIFIMRYLYYIRRNNYENEELVLDALIDENVVASSIIGLA